MESLKTVGRYEILNSPKFGIVIRDMQAEDPMFLLTNSGDGTIRFPDAVTFDSAEDALLFIEALKPIAVVTA